MADFVFNPSASNRPSDPYDGRDFGIELAALPTSRAPSYFSKISARDGANNDDYDDDVSLIKHDRKTSKSGFTREERAVRTVSHTPTVASNRQKRRRLQGWKFGVAASAWVAFTVLVLNLILTIVVSLKFGTSNGVGTAITGNCEVVNSWTTWLHILINALSSILLSASNYTMQCLCSPTRKEIDQAHAKGDWLDVGVASVRNIFRIRWSRRIVWWFLALSSVPIHLLYNSAIFKTLDANEYSVGTVSADFLKGGPFNNVYTDLGGYNQTLSLDDDRTMHEMQSFFAQNYQNDQLVQNLTVTDCIKTYATTFVTGHGNILAVTGERSNIDNYTMWSFSDAQISITAGGDGNPPFDWICDDAKTFTDLTYCSSGAAREQAPIWTINHKKIDYCLAQVLPSNCKLQFSVHILVTVICMNACKSLCMFLTMYRQREATLVTIGDALSSFLVRPDEITKGRCLMAKSDVDEGPLRWRVHHSKEQPVTAPLPVTYHKPLRRRWFAGASGKRWTTTILLCIGALLTGMILLGIGVSSLNGYLNNSQSPLSLGFGAVDARALINVGLPQSGASGLVSSVLLANLPQAIVSFIYLTYNSLLTSMMLSHEYSLYGMEGRKKALRVTTPHGQQRSTYYLQLPYTYSIPLIIASGSLHWLISQSIFLARVSINPNGGTSSPEDVSQVGYSCLPILIVVLLGIAMTTFALAIGLRKFASSMPVAGSCSVALAAACHPPKHDTDAAYLPVNWGAVADEPDSKEPDSDVIIGHCTFTSEEVHDLVPGRLYAGVRHNNALVSSMRRRLTFIVQGTR